MIRLRWNPDDPEEKACAIRASEIYVQAGLIPFVQGIRQSCVDGSSGEASFCFRPSSLDRVISGNFLEDDDDGSSQGT